MPTITGGPAKTQSLNTPAGATPTATWATLPDPTTIAGMIYRVSDFGVAGVGLQVISDGTRWVPICAQMLSRSAVGASVTSTAAETALATVTVPAGLLGLNGGLLIYSTWSTTSSANNKTPRIRLGGVSGSIFFAPIITTNAGVSDMRRIRNRNSAASQVSSFTTSANSIGLLGVAPVTASVDTSASVDLVLSSQLALSTETITLENYEVWVTP